MNIINTAKQYGKVIVGLLTDSAIGSYKRLPALNYEQRKVVVENLRGVDDVIPQDTLDYIPNLEKIKPDYVVHGDDWKSGPDKILRKNAINALKQYGGKLIEVPYTKGVSSGVYIDAQRINNGHE